MFLEKLTKDPDKAVKIILSITITVISTVSFFAGYFFNLWFGVGAFISGMLLIMLPAWLSLRAINKPDNENQERSRT